MANAWLLLGITRFNLNRPGDAIPALSKYTGMQHRRLVVRRGNRPY